MFDVGHRLYICHLIRNRIDTLVCETEGTAASSAAVHACVHVSFFLSYEEHSASNAAGSVCSILHLRARLADSNSLWFSGLVVRSA